MKGADTYNIVFHSIDLGIQITQLDDAITPIRPYFDRAQVVFDFTNFQDSCLHKSPSTELLSELSIRGLALLAIESLNLRIEPCVFQSLDGA